MIGSYNNITASVFTYNPVKQYSYLNNITTTATTTTATEVFAYNPTK